MLPVHVNARRRGERMDVDGESSIEESLASESLTMHVLVDDLAESEHAPGSGGMLQFRLDALAVLDQVRRRARPTLLVGALLALVLASMQAGRPPTVVALASTNGSLARAPTQPVALQWTVGLPVESHVVAVGSVVVSSPAMAGDGDLVVTAHRTSTGSPAWSASLPSTATAVIVDPMSGISRRIGGLSRYPTQRGPDATEPAPADLVVGLRAGDGAELWRVATDQAQVATHASTVSIVGAQRCTLVATQSGRISADVPAPCAADTTGSTMVHGSPPSGWTTSRRNGPALPTSTTPPLVDGAVVVTTTEEDLRVGVLEDGGTRTLFALPLVNEACSLARPVAAVGAVADCIVRQGLQVPTGTVLDLDGSVLAAADSTAQLEVVTVDGQRRALAWERRPQLDTVRLVDLAGPRVRQVVAEHPGASFEVLHNGGSSPATADGVLAVLVDQGERTLALLSWRDLSTTWEVPLPPGGVVDSLAATHDLVVAVVRTGDGSHRLLGFG